MDDFNKIIFSPFLKNRVTIQVNLVLTSPETDRRLVSGEVETHRTE